MIRPILAAALMGCTLLATACTPPSASSSGEAPAATETAASIIAITNPWSRETAQGQNAGGAFMTIANTGTAGDRLTGGTTPVADRVEIHTMVMDGEVMRMRRLADGLDVPAGGEVALKPGSFHIMLMGLRQPLKAGAKVPLTLTFQSAGTAEIELEVRPAGAMDHSEAEHGKHG